MGTATQRAPHRAGFEVYDGPVTKVGENAFTLGANSVPRAFEPHDVCLGGQKLTLWIEQRTSVSNDERVPAIVQTALTGATPEHYRAVTLSSHCYGMVRRDPEHVTHRVYARLGIDI